MYLGCLVEYFMLWALFTHKKGTNLNHWLTRKRLFLLSLMPTLGLLVAITLNIIAGSGYTGAVNQSALMVYGMGTIIWTIITPFIGAFLYTKCSSMNTKKFVPGILSVALGAAIPWIIDLH